MILRIITFLLLFLLLPSLSHAKTMHLYALAMHGNPLYSKDYKHFDYVNPNAPKGGDLKTSKNGSFDNLNPLVILGNKVAGLGYLNDKLMQRAWNEPFTLYGLVAKSIDISEDRSEITFNLNPRARFHDGKPMTAEDVKFSYEMYRKYGHPVRRRVYGLIKKVKIISDYSIKFTFGEGYDRESALILAMMQVLPKHYWEKNNISKTTLKIPLGSGPYKIKSVEPGRKIVYERVKDYWAKDLPVNKGLYNFDTLTYSYYRDDDIALQSFKAGEYNLRNEYNIHKWKTAYNFKALDEGKVIKEEIAHSRPEWLKAMIFNTRRSIFKDKNVRQALGLIFDFNWINKSFFFNYFKRIDSVFPNSELKATGIPKGTELELLERYKDKLPKEVFGDMWQPPLVNMRSNKRKAISLLKKSGWVYKDEKLFNKVTGKPFNFEILLNNPNDEKIALAFSQSLKKIGINLTVRTVDSAQFAGRLDNFDYDMVMYRWINSLSPGNEQLNYWGSAAATNKGSRNYAGVNNSAIDAIAGSIAQSIDRKTLVARSHALDRALMWNYYFIPMYYLGRDMVSYSSEIHRPEKTPIYGIVREAWWFNNNE